MSEYGELIAPDTVRFERVLPGPIERVWQYLTESDKRATWLAAGEAEQRAGGKIELHFHNAALSEQPDIEPPEKYRDLPERMSFAGEVRRCEPPHTLVHTWVDGEDYSEVTFELTEQGSDVRLVLTHRRLKESELIGVCGGWHTHLDILGEVLNEQPVQPFWKRHSGLETEYEQRVAAAS